MNTVTEESVQTKTNKQPMNGYITVWSINCSLKVTDQGQNPRLTVSNIMEGSRIYFRTPNRYPLAEQNWFHFKEANKDIYFDNCILVYPTGRKNVCESYIEFEEVPNTSNTSDNHTSPIRAKFDIVNENGWLNDPELIIEF